MEKTKTYFYMETNEEKPYIVFKVTHKIGNIDLAERKAKTIAKQLNQKLAGGYFCEGCEPYNLNDYVIIEIQKNTKPQKPTAQDDFINTLISYEDGELNEDESLKFLKKLKKTGLGNKLQGSYGALMEQID